MLNDLHDYKAGELQSTQFDKPCQKCGTIIAFSKGIKDCPRCTDLTNEELIALHKQQAEEFYSRRSLGFWFLAICIILTVLLFFVLP